MMTIRFFLLFLFAVFALPASAQVTEIPADELQELLRVKIRAVTRLAANRSMIKAVKKQNAQGLTLQEIKKRDDAWRSTKGMTSFKKSLQTNRAGSRLSRAVRRNPTYGEAFLTDNQGANVAAYPATSDYWQGDETKFTASYNKGSGKVFIGPVEYDDSSKTHAVQVSVPVLNRGETIGVLIVGVKLDYLAWKKTRIGRRY